MKSIRTFITALAITFGLLWAVPPASALSGTIYVDDDCSPPGNGSLSDPFCTIQEAEDNADPFAIIRVAPGNYPENVNVDVPNLTIQGPAPTQGIATVKSFNLAADKITLSYFLISPDAGSAGIVTSGSHSGYNISRNEITGGDYGILYASSGVYPSYISRNNIHDNSTGFGILTTGPASNTTIDRNTFSNLSNNSVRSIFPSSNLTIEYNTSTNVRTPFHIGAVTNLIIRYNTSSAFAPGGSGIYLAGGNTNGTITYNTITGPSTFHGIDVDSPLGVNSNINISYNKIYNMGGHGILVNANSLSSGSLIANNTIEGSALDGILINTPGNSGLTLRYNRLKNNAHHDLHDNTVGSGTANTANTYLYNYCNTSSPNGLCKFANP